MGFSDRLEKGLRERGVQGYSKVEQVGFCCVLFSFVFFFVVFGLLNRGREEESQESGFRHVNLEMSVRYPSGDVKMQSDI